MMLKAMKDMLQISYKKGERGSYAHARKNESDIAKKVMSKLFVGILLASVLIGILAVVPENVRAEKPDMVVEDGTISVLNEDFNVDKSLAHEYAWATIDTKDEQLRVYYREKNVEVAGLAKVHEYGIDDE